MASKKKLVYEHLEHGFGPCFDSESKILILGSFPSVKSREIAFYYGHPQNRFWSILSEVFQREIGKTIDEKRAFIHDTHLALYDVIESCDIIGSSDTSIKNVVTTDILSLIKSSKIDKIILNGKKAGSLFERYQLTKIPPSITYEVLPSTSPANAAINKSDLCARWKKSLSSLLQSENESIK